MFRHVNFRSIEFSGLFNFRIHTEISKKLFRIFENTEITDFTHNGERSSKTSLVGMTETCKSGFSPSLAIPIESRANNYTEICDYIIPERY